MFFGFQYYMFRQLTKIQSAEHFWKKQTQFSRLLLQTHDFRKYIFPTDKEERIQIRTPQNVSIKLK